MWMTDINPLVLIDRTREIMIYGIVQMEEN